MPLFFIAPYLFKEKPVVDKSFFKLIAISLLATGNVTLFAIGVQFTEAFVSQTLYTIVPIVTCLFSYLLLREKFGKKKITGILLGFFGAVYIIFLPVLSHGPGGHTGLLGNIIMLAAVILFSLYAVVSKKALNKFSPIFINAVFVVCTAISLLPFFIIDHFVHPLWWRHVSDTAMYATLYVALFGTVLFYLLYQYAIKRATPVIATLIQFILPVTVLIWAYFLLGERLTANFLLGALFIFAGSWLTVRSKNN